MAKQSLPQSREVTSFCAAAFQRLGGTFTIGSNGVRYAGRPEPVLFRLQDKPLPQLPNAQPWEQFQSAAEWRDAVKLLDWVLARVDPADAQFVYDAFATAAAGEGEDFRKRL